MQYEHTYRGQRLWSNRAAGVAGRLGLAGAGVRAYQRAEGRRGHVRTPAGLRLAPWALAHDTRDGGAGDTLAVDEQRISYSSYAEPGAVPWRDHGVDIVLECSGKFRTPETLAAYFQQGVRKVIVAAPVKQQALNVVFGTLSTPVLLHVLPRRNYPPIRPKMLSLHMLYYTWASDLWHGGRP